jgi:hypothetical protein
MKVFTLNLKDHETGYITKIHIQASTYTKANEILSKWWRGWEE